MYALQVASILETVTIRCAWGHVSFAQKGPRDIIRTASRAADLLINVQPNIKNKKKHQNELPILCHCPKK